MIGTTKSATSYNSCNLTCSSATDCDMCKDNQNNQIEGYYSYSLTEILPEPDTREKFKNPLDRIRLKKNFKAIQDLHRRKK